MKLLKVYEYSRRDYFDFLKSKFDLMDIDFGRNSYNEIDQLKLRLKSGVKKDKNYLLPLIEEFGKYYWTLENSLGSVFFVINIKENEIYDHFKKFDLEMNTGKYNL